MKIQKENITVLFVLNCALLYGANRSALDLVDGMKENNRRVTFLFIISEKGPIEIELRRRRIRYYVIPYKQNIKESGRMGKNLHNQLSNLKQAIKFLPVLKKHQVDIIHTNSSNIDFGAVLSVLASKKHIWHFREMLSEHYDLHWFLPALQQWYMRKSDAVIYISHAVERKYHSKRVKEHVVYNGVVRQADRNPLCESAKKTDSIFYLLCAGVIMEGKGQMDAVRAVDYVRKNSDYHLHLSIVGSGQAAYINQIKSYVKRNQMEEYVEILPYQKDLTEIRSCSDIALVPSRSEGLGRVTIESMDAGLLTIGADSGATSEIITAGQTGYLYPVGNSRRLALTIEEAIRDILAGNDTTIRNNAKQYVLDQFECHRQAEAIYTIYQHVMR